MLTRINFNDDNTSYILLQQRIDVITNIFRSNRTNIRYWRDIRIIRSKFEEKILF